MPHLDIHVRRREGDQGERKMKEKRERKRRKAERKKQGKNDNFFKSSSNSRR